MGLAFGSLVGLSLGLVGGGGAVLAVPMLVYGLGLPARQAVGVSLASVGATSLVGFWQRWRGGEVEVPGGLLFATTGILGAPLGVWLGGHLSEAVLLGLFGGLMVVVAARMWSQASASSLGDEIGSADHPGPVCRIGGDGRLKLTSPCAIRLGLVGFGSGLLSGLLGVGGGFIIVPALVLLSGMPMRRAVGTSLLVISLISLAGVVSHATAGRDLPIDIIVWFTLGGVLGLLVGQSLANRLSGEVLQKVFVVVMLGVATFVLVRGVVGT